MRSVRRRSLTRTTLLTLVHALVVTKVDYCSSVLSGISGQLLQQLQSVFNPAARLVFCARKSEHITPLLRELHWLKVPERIQFRLCVLALSARRRHTLLRPSSWLPCRFTSSSAEWFYVDTGHTIHTTHHAGWSSLPGDCCSSVECSSSICLCSFCTIAAAVLPRPQDGTVSVIILFTTVSICVTDCNF